MAAVKGKVVEGGRIIVPAAFRKSMGLSKGDSVFMELHGDELRVRGLTRPMPLNPTRHRKCAHLRRGAAPRMET
jgi:bifunctional DNA-binding transcriptional regulator/antitoxin component of YhaV-PrlF toxin-antitoxin module